MMNAHTRGVKVAFDGTASAGPARTFVSAEDAKFKIVHFYDERGNQTSMMVFQVGNEYYVPKNSVEWCSGCRPVSKWVADGLRKSEAHVGEVPSEDAVNVMEE